MWDAQHWANLLQDATRRRDDQSLRVLRLNVFLDTVRDVQRGFYISQSGATIPLPDDDEHRFATRLYSQEPLQWNGRNFSKPPLITVTENDCLGVASTLCDTGKKVAVLTMSNRHHPGGGVLDGSPSQEEYVMRSSTYYRHIYQFDAIGEKFGVPRRKESYPMWAIYSPEVTVFRTEEKEGYAKLDTPFSVSVIAVAAIRGPELLCDERQRYWLADELVNPTKRRIRTIFRIAKEHGHTTLVAGAFGCGSFANPPNHIALLFSEVLQEEEFTRSFEQIIFAIMEDQNSYRWFNPEGNIKPFKEVFQKEGGTQ